MQVLVYEKSTGKVLSLALSPTADNIKEWLKEHPEYEVVEPGSEKAEKFSKKNDPKSKLQQVSLPHTPTTPKHEIQLFSNPAKIHTGASANTPKQTEIVVRKVGPKLTPPNKPIVVKSNPASTSNTPKTPTSPVKRTSTNAGFDKKSTLPPSKFKKQTVGTPSSTITQQKTPTEKMSPKVRMQQERDNVKRILKDTLIQRLAHISSSNPNIRKLTEDEATEFAAKIEEEMFHSNNKDTNDKKYKNKYRSLKFNLSDVKNVTLIERICNKSLTPKQLVEFNSAELASEELSKWRKNENKHTIDLITKCELESLHQGQTHVMKTHKGEEIIESSKPLEILEINNPLIDSVEATSSGKDRYDSFSIKTGIIDGKIITTSPLSSPSVSSSTGKKEFSRRSRSPRSRSRSRGRERDRGHHHHHKSSSKHKKRRSKSRSHSKERHRSRDRRRSKSKDKEREKKHDKKPEKKVDKRDSKEKDNKKEAIAKKLIKEEIEVKQEDCNLIDKILATTGCLLKVERPGAPATLLTPKETVKKESGAEIIKVEITDEAGIPITSTIDPIDAESVGLHPAEIIPKNYVDPDPIEEYNIPIDIYSGRLFMVDVVDLSITASLISGNVDDIIKDFPQKLEVVGRISPKTVWDYLSKLKKIPGREIIVIRFGSEDEENYVNLFSYLFTKDRYGVIKPESASIKDFYLVPLEAKHPMPQILLPINGPGFLEKDNKPDLLLGVIIKISSELQKVHFRVNFLFVPRILTSIFF